MAIERMESLAGWIIEWSDHDGDYQRLRPEHCQSAVDAGVQIHPVAYATEVAARAAADALALWERDYWARHSWLQPRYHWQHLRVCHYDGSYRTLPGSLSIGGGGVTGPQG